MDDLIKKILLITIISLFVIIILAVSICGVIQLYIDKFNEPNSIISVCTCSPV